MMQSSTGVVAWWSGGLLTLAVSTMVTPVPAFVVDRIVVKPGASRPVQNGVIPSLWHPSLNACSPTPCAHDEWWSHRLVSVSVKP